MRRRALLTALGAVLPAGFAGCAQLRAGEDETPEDDPTATDTPTASTPDATATPTPEPTPESVTLAEHELVRDRTDTPDELVRVVGVARNDGGAPLADLVATAEFRTADGAFVDATAAELAELRPGKRWQFSLTFPGSGEDARSIADYRLRIDVGE